MTNNLGFDFKDKQFYDGGPKLLFLRFNFSYLNLLGQEILQEINEYAFLRDKNFSPTVNFPHVGNLNFLQNLQTR